jgi:hypothetical protein
MELRSCGARVASAAEANEGSDAQNFAILGKTATREAPLVFVRESKRRSVVATRICLPCAIEEAQLFHDIRPGVGSPYRCLVRRRCRRA